MDKSAIEKIVALGAPNISEHNGYTYTDKPLSVIVKPQVKEIKFRTLKGLTETLKTEFNMFTSPLLVCVSEHDSVTVCSAISSIDRSRETPYSACAETPSFDFNRYISYESMIIALKSKFIETTALNELVQLLGTITEENNVRLVDDGFSQTVVVKKGVALKENKVVNPRVRLMPYRTFLDVSQPESEFLLRLDCNGNVALFEADGGAWRLEARQIVASRLRNDLKELIDDGVVIIVE